MTISAATAISAEGARVAFATCEQCGAALLLHPSDQTDRVKQHLEWHDAHDHAEGADQ